MSENPTLYNIANCFTLGTVETIDGAINPDKFFSLEHWMDSFGTASMIYAAYKLAKKTVPNVTNHDSDLVDDVVDFEVKFREGYDNLLIEVQDIVRKKNKGVVGGHNYDNFKKAFEEMGYNIDACIIKKTEHPTIPSIYQLDYRIPSLRYGPTGSLEIIPGEYKTAKNPKTVYDPLIIPDS